MRSLRLGVLAGLAAIGAACSQDGVTEPAQITPSPAFAKGQGKVAADPTAKWYVPVADAGLALRSDGQFTAGGYSVYANGVCGVDAQIFAKDSYAGEFDPAGDATISTASGSPSGGRKACARRFTIVYPDGQSEAVASFNRVRHMANRQYVIPVGAMIRRLLVVNPGYVNSPSRCDRLIFGQFARADGELVGVGSDSVMVTRINARKWHVQSESTELNKATCEKTGEIFTMPVDFIIEASEDLPAA